MKCIDQLQMNVKSRCLRTRESAHILASSERISTEYFEFNSVGFLPSSTKNDDGTIEIDVNGSSLRIRPKTTHQLFVVRAPRAVALLGLRQHADEGPDRGVGPDVLGVRERHLDASEALGIAVL